MLTSHQRLPQITTIDQANDLLVNFINQVKQSLSQIIVSMQSDSLLQQMRNDQNLYQEKINYIQGFIKQYFKVKMIDQKILQQIVNLKQENSNLSQNINEVKQLYIKELANIQIQYNLFLKQKQTQKQSMQDIIQNKNVQIQQLLSKLKVDIEYEKTFEKLQNDNKKLQNQLNELNGQIQSYQAQTSKLKSQQSKPIQSKKQKTCIPTQTQSKQTQLVLLQQKLQQQSQLNNKLILQINQLKDQHKQTLYQYQETIQKMKQDMGQIRMQWEQKCNQVENQLTQQYRNKLIFYQLNMIQQLNAFREDMKLGKNIIIQSSQQILQTKHSVMHQKYMADKLKYQRQMQLEVQRYSNQFEKQNQAIHQLQAQVIQMKKHNNDKQRSISQLKTSYQNQLKQKQHLIQAIQKQFQQKLLNQMNQTHKKVSQYQKQLQRVHKTQSMLLKQNKQQKQQKQSIQNQIILIRKEFQHFKSNNIQLEKKIKMISEEKDNINTNNLELKRDIALANQKNFINQKFIKQLNLNISKIDHQNSKLKNDLNNQQSFFRKNQLKLAEANLKLKHFQNWKVQTSKKIDNLHVSIRKAKKQSQLIKQDILYFVNIQKKKFLNVISLLKNQIQKCQDQIQYKNKQKMQQLIDQIDTQKQQQLRAIHIAQHENQNLKKQIKIMEQIIEKNQAQHTYEKQKAFNRDLQHFRRKFQQDLRKERQQNRTLEEKIYNINKKNDYLFAKAQKQVAKNIRQFQSKWQAQILDMQETLQSKEKSLIQITKKQRRLQQSMDQMKQRVQQSLQKGQKQQQKGQKQQQKYILLKQQRDKSISQLMSRLQKQCRHKLSLQKQLKQIRSQLIKTQSTTPSPFNNYSFTQRQNTNIHTNQFTLTNDKSDKGEKVKEKSTMREKELKEIRHMIAKTYEVVDVPEKDSIGRKAKLF